MDRVKNGSNGPVQTGKAVVRAARFARTRSARKIAVVNLPPAPADSPGTTRRFALALISSVVLLALLFTAQDGMRRSADGIPVNWSRTFAINALDWVVWGILVPFIVLIGQRIRLDGAGRRAARIVGWACLAGGFCIVQSTITGLTVRLIGPSFFGLAPPGGGGGFASRPLGAFLLNWGLSTASLNLLMFGMTAGVFHAALYYRDLRARQVREATLQARLARAELNVLRMQLQPHFLFNALHTVSSLMLTDVPTAQSVVTAVGDLLRASLDHTARQEIPLGDELAFVRRYLDIQRARFRQRLVVEIATSDALLDALVPSLVLQPLVENAIRHGIEPRARGGRVWITAERRGDAIALTVRNDGPGDERSPANGNGATNGRGIGLANIEARLQQLYGASHTFRARHGADGSFDVTLTLPFHTDASLFPAAAGVQ